MHVLESTEVIVFNLLHYVYDFIEIHLVFTVVLCILIRLHASIHRKRSSFFHLSPHVREAAGGASGYSLYLFLFLCLLFLA